MALQPKVNLEPIKVLEDALKNMAERNKKNPTVFMPHFNKIIKENGGVAVIINNPILKKYWLKKYNHDEVYKELATLCRDGNFWNSLEPKHQKLILKHFPEIRRDLYTNREFIKQLEEAKILASFQKKLGLTEYAKSSKPKSAKAKSPLLKQTNETKLAWLQDKKIWSSDTSRLLSKDKVGAVKNNFSKNSKQVKLKKGEVLELADGKVRLHHTVIKIKVAKGKDKLVALIPKAKALGAGAFGTVKVAQDIETGEIYALKVQKKDKEVAKGSLAEQEILNERNLGNKQGMHVGAAKRNTIRKGKTVSREYELQELAPATELRKLIERQNISSDKSFLIAANICQAFYDLHNKDRIIHRDIKPENLLVSSKGEVLVIDFGLARALPKGKDFIDTGIHCGTPNYLAPENGKFIKDINNKYKLKLESTKYDHNSDKFAIGLTLKELLEMPNIIGYTQDASHHILSGMLHTKPNYRNNLLAVKQQMLFNHICVLTGADHPDIKAIKKTYQEAIKLAKTNPVTPSLLKLFYSSLGSSFGKNKNIESIANELKIPIFALAKSSSEAAINFYKNKTNWQKLSSSQQKILKKSYGKEFLFTSPNIKIDFNRQAPINKLQILHNICVELYIKEQKLTALIFLKYKLMKIFQ